MACTLTEFNVVGQSSLGGNGTLQHIDGIGLGIGHVVAEDLPLYMQQRLQRKGIAEVEKLLDIKSVQ